MTFGEGGEGEREEREVKRVKSCGGKRGEGNEREREKRGRGGRQHSSGYGHLIISFSSPSPGAVMALVFVFVLPTGALVSRYYQAVFGAWFKVPTRHIPRLLVGGMGMGIGHWTKCLLLAPSLFLFHSLPFSQPHLPLCLPPPLSLLPRVT